MDEFAKLIDGRINLKTKGQFMKTVPAVVTIGGTDTATVNILSENTTCELLNMTGTKLSVGDQVQVYSCGKTMYIGASRNVSGSSITVDSALSSSSTNPVQNKVINTALSNKQATIWTSSYGFETNGNIRKLEKALSPHTGSLRFKPQKYNAEWVDMGMAISSMTKGTAQVEWHIGSISVTLTNGDMVSVPIPTFTHAENFIRSVGGTARNTLSFTSDSQRFVSVTDDHSNKSVLIVETVSEMLFNWTSGYVYFTLYITVHPYYPLPASADQMYIAFDTASYNASATNASAITSLIGW